MPATTIDEVIKALDDIIDATKNANSTLAFFACLYRQVTVRVKEGIENNEFDDGEQMERLDVLFANRYLNAYQEFRSGGNCTQSWQRTFDASIDKNLLVMQHLLLGINAHINLDLGIAASETVRDGQLADFETDFDKINAILASMVNDVQERIKKVSPLFILLEKWGKGKEDKLVSFSIKVARDGAWLFANEYHVSHNRQEKILNRDTSIARLAEKLIAPKSWLLRTLIKIIRFFETKDVAKVTQVMST